MTDRPLAPATPTGRDYREMWWDFLIWLRCHILRQHSPQRAYESKPWEPLLDRRNGYYWRPNGRLECSGCKRDLGPDPDGVGAWS